MVWGLFPVDPLAGEDKYFIFGKGTYKVGRKGCDVIISKDKGVSRIHAEIIVDEMISMTSLRSRSKTATRVRIRDCSKYGTFINNSLGKKEKVHEFANKETTLKDGDVVWFGTGSAAYRFSFIPLTFLDCSASESPSIQRKVSSIGANFTCQFSEECTHVVTDDSTPIKDDLIDAIIAKKPIVGKGWIELLTEKSIGTEIPSWNLYIPTLAVEGVSVKVVDSGTRANCLKGYSCLLESTLKYKLRDKFQAMLEVSGAKVFPVEDFCSNSQGWDYGENNRLVYVIPGDLVDKSPYLSKLSSLLRVNETDLLSAIFSGHLDSSLLISPPVVVSSSCSTDETIVADSEEEVETATSSHGIINISSEEVPIYENVVEKSLVHSPISEETIKGVKKVEASMIHHSPTSKVEAPKRVETVQTSTVQSPTSPENNYDGGYTDGKVDMMTLDKKEANESECGKYDVIYSQDLIARNSSLPAATSSDVDNSIVNFKCFRKRKTPSGNSFNSLIPFSKYPYKETEYGNQEMLKSVKEEKKRKQMEAVAEDLFNKEEERPRKARSRAGLLGYR